MNEAKQKPDLLVIGKYLSLQDRDKTIITDGGVAICRDIILETGTAADLADKYPDAGLLATEHGLIMPGLVNTHIHAGRAFPADKSESPAETAYRATLLALASMIKSGTTSFCSKGISAMDTARAARESGMRAWIAVPVNDFPEPHDAALKIRQFEELYALYADNPLINIIVTARADASTDLLRQLNELAERYDTPMSIQLPGNRAEAKDFQKKFDCGPIIHLANLGLLNSRTVLNHCRITTEAEIELLAEKEVQLTLCPENDMKHGAEISPVAQMLAAGIPVGLGTGNGFANNVDLFGAMNTVTKLHKVKTLDPTALPAEIMLNMATMGGAGVLCAEEEIGSLEPGKKADLIVLDLDQPHLTPMYNIPSHMVYAARGADVVHSVINGRIVMQDRRLKTLDAETMLADMC